MNTTPEQMKNPFHYDKGKAEIMDTLHRRSRGELSGMLKNNFGEGSYPGMGIERYNSLGKYQLQSSRKKQVSHLT